MSKPIPAAHWACKTPTPTLTLYQRAVWLVYAGFSDPRTDARSAGRHAYPSARTVAGILDRTGRPVEELDPAPAKRARAELVEQGFLVPDGEYVPTDSDGRLRRDKATPIYTVTHPERGDSTVTQSEPLEVNPLETARPSLKNETSAARADNDYSITEANIRSIFDVWSHQLRYGRRVQLTAARRDVICFALREHRGTVEQIRAALVNVAAACPDREDQRCTDLPHLLHRDRLGDAIADDIDPDDWTSSPFGDEY